ncbi:hypothetical protein [Nocardioides sp. SYSU DS0663]|uniref:hypothetical protein n=1 Tax=Nocardioides sp. SYSU DS0663 TaxID=3416445 RepID=UPI003F4BC181
MRPLAAAPRGHLTAAAVRGLLTAPSVSVTAGLELLDGANAVVEDISAVLERDAEGALVSGSVSWDNRDAVHASCRLALQRELVWGRDRVRPYMEFSRRVGSEVVVAHRPVPDRVTGELRNIVSPDLVWVSLGSSTVTPNVSWGGRTWTQVAPATNNHGARLNVPLDRFTQGVPYRASVRVANNGPTAVTVHADLGDIGAGSALLQPGAETVIRTTARTGFDATYRFVDVSGPAGSSILVREPLVAQTADAPPNYFDGNTPGAAMYDYAWLGSAGSSQSLRRTVERHHITNWCPNPQPATGAGWAISSGGVVDSPWRSGAKAITSVAPGNSTPYAFSRQSSRAWRVGETVYVAMTVQVPVGHVFAVDVHRRDGNVYYSGNWHSGTRRIAGTGAPQTVTATWTLTGDVPAGSLDVAMVWALPGGGPPAAGATAIVSDAVISDQPIPSSPLDGDTADTDTHAYWWTGTPHASTSVRREQITTRTTQPKVESARFNLGVFVLTTPDTRRGEEPPTFEVTGYDLLSLLQTGPADTWVVTSGTTYFSALQAIVDASGIGARLLLDGTLQSTTVPATRVWAVTDPVTSWLRMMIDLLAEIGYTRPWMDDGGNIRSRPYQDVAVRPVEWTLDTSDEATNLVGEERTLTVETGEIANAWRFARTNMDTTPTEGDGIYTPAANQSEGPNSIDALGRTIWKFRRLDAADQAALVAQGDQIRAADMAAVRTISLETDPLPIMEQDDVFQFTDAGESEKIAAASWTINLDGSPGDLQLGGAPAPPLDPVETQAKATVTSAAPLRVVVDGATTDSFANALDAASYSIGQRVTVTIRNPLPPLVQGVES